MVTKSLFPPQSRDVRIIPLRETWREWFFIRLPRVSSAVPTGLNEKAFPVVNNNQTWPSAHRWIDLNATNACSRGYCKPRTDEGFNGFPFHSPSQMPQKRIHFPD